MQINTEKMQATMALILLSNCHQDDMLPEDSFEQIVHWISKLGADENSVVPYFYEDSFIIEQSLKILEDYINKVAP